jgi:biopolymer transport protein TolR
VKLEEGRRRRLMSDINVVPLVDVVLVLLVIFMITAPMLYRGIDIDLPQSSANTIKPTQRVIVTVEKDETVFVDKDKIPLDQLEEKLQRIKAQSAETTIYLRGDKTVPYGTIIRVMDMIKKVGIEKLGMVTEPVPNPKS